MAHNTSELKIMHSPAGYYIGREWYETDPKFKDEYPTEPYSRNSIYFKTKEEAESAFKMGCYTVNDNKY